jgi:DNA-binding CsgD family transcriptional regulator
MIMPVRRMNGHPRVVLSALFSALDGQAQSAAGHAYDARGPLATEYLRLWQRDRARQRQQQALEQAIDSVGVGLVLVDREANILFANAAARSLLSSGDGLRMDGDRIRAERLKDSIRLHAALEHVTSSGVCDAPMLSIARASAMPLILLAMPIDGDRGEAGAIAAILYVIDPAADVSAVLEPLCRIYQLTPTETKLACLLAAGGSLVATAGKMKIKEQTARSVLKQIFRKTGTARQGELIALLYSSIVRTHHPARIEAI